MKRIWEYFDNMDEFAYVADMDTYELIYMNKKGLNSYGFSSVNEILGRKCYELLQNCSAPCAICNNTSLLPGFFQKWQYYNPIIQKNLILLDSMLEENGKRYRFEIAIDISEQKKQEQIAKKYQEIEKLMVEGLRVAFRKSTPDETLGILIEHLGKSLNADRTYIFERNTQGNEDNTYEWVAAGVKPSKDNLQNVPSEICAGWYRQFKEGKQIVIEDVEQLRASDPLMYDILRPQNISSLIIMPIYDNKKNYRILWSR